MLTPYQERLHVERQQRLARIAGRAVLDRPIDLRATEEAAKVSSLAWQPPEPIEKPAPEPAFSFTDWLKRQEELNPFPKEFMQELRRLVDVHIGRDGCPRIDHIQKVVASAYGVHVRDLKAARRTLNVVRPRQIAMYLAKMLTLASLPEIGRRFGGRDHTTVLHAIKKLDAVVEKDSAFAAEIESLRAQIMGESV